MIHTNFHERLQILYELNLVDNCVNADNKNNTTINNNIHNKQFFIRLTNNWHLIYDQNNVVGFLSQEQLAVKKKNMGCKYFIFNWIIIWYFYYCSKKYFMED